VVEVLAVINGRRGAIAAIIAERLADAGDLDSRSDEPDGY